MRKKRKSEGSNSEAWLATYADLVTLLLCFFVLLFSFSEIDAQKFQAVMKSFQGSLGILKGGKTLEEMPYTNTENLPEDSIAQEIQEIEDFKKLKTYIENYAEKKGLETKLVVQIDERGLIIRILDNVFFDSGKAQIKPKAKEVILYIGEALNKNEIRDKHIKIEGHTDNVPMNTKEFPSNWVLSVIRATNVLELLEDEVNISSKRLSASGYGSYRPVAPNDTPENKAKNRRVDIVILKSYFNKWEPN